MFNINACTWFVKTWLTINRKMDFIKCVYFAGFASTSYHFGRFFLLRFVPNEPAKICQINIKLNQSIILLTWLFNAQKYVEKAICWHSRDICLYHLIVLTHSDYCDCRYCCCCCCCCCSRCVLMLSWLLWTCTSRLIRAISCLIWSSVLSLFHVFRSLIIYWTFECFRGRYS